MANPPKKTRGFEGATEKACIEASSARWRGWGECRGGHALVVDPGCWLGSEGGEAEHGFQADPHPMLLTTHAIRSPLVCKTQLALPVPPSTTDAEGAEDGPGKRGRG